MLKELRNSFRGILELINNIYQNKLESLLLENAKITAHNQQLSAEIKHLRAR